METTTRYIVKRRLKTINIELCIKDSGHERSTACDPEEAVPILRAIYRNLDADQEHFTVLMLDKANRIAGYKTVHSGAMDEASIDPRIVFRNAILLGATAIILAHNHPSQNCSPSREDIAITRQLQDAGKLLAIKVLDHIILGGDQFFSFAERGILRPEVL